MPILNYTASISFEKTIGEITRVLVNHGAQKIVVDYQGKVPSAITFCLMVNDRLVAYCLPSNHTGVLAAMKKNRRVPGRLCTTEQSLRVSWRILKDWVEAQMAITEAGLAEVAEVFMPYAVMQSGNTMYQEFTSGNIKLLN